ncbi:hypothetical protein FPV67DRAFT_1739906 [Lyophyllum atratum]|nr:hypothetical protein FPV67DRAFT_1739906 [Lyophyllum atratum]
MSPEEIQNMITLFSQYDQWKNPKYICNTNIFTKLLFDPEGLYATNMNWNQAARLLNEILSLRLVFWYISSLVLRRTLADWDTETLTGLSKIRTYQVQVKILQSYTVPVGHPIGHLWKLLVLGALFAAGFRNTIDPSKFVVQVFSEMIPQFTQNEQNMNAVQRVLHYINSLLCIQFSYCGIWPWVHKVACDFGWDWGPVFVPVGIYKWVHLVPLPSDTNISTVQTGPPPIDIGFIMTDTGGILTAMNLNYLNQKKQKAVIRVMMAGMRKSRTWVVAQEEERRGIAKRRSFYSEEEHLKSSKIFGMSSSTFS